MISAFAVVGIGLVAVPVYAAGCTSGAECVKAGVKASGGTSSKTEIGPLIKTIVNVLLFILGAISVIMIIIGGIKYTTSNGDSTGVTSAKNTIMYAVIGLVVALMATAIVNYIIDQFV